MTIARAAARDSAISALPIDLPLLVWRKVDFEKTVESLPAKRAPITDGAPLFSERLHERRSNLVEKS